MFNMFAEPPIGGRLRGTQPRLNKGPPGPGSDLQNSYKTRKTLKMSQLPAPERGPVNVMSLQAPKDLKGRLQCLTFNKHNFAHMFHVEVRFRQPAVRFRKPVAQIVPLARV
jgi:hypothetical protein